MSITQFTMEEVRCFGERQTLEIRPLTFLVGENSTGKTTALACFHVLSNYLCHGDLDFNADPYALGTFKDIVRNSNKKEKNFKIGFTSRFNSEDVQVTVEFVKKKESIEPSVRSLRMKFADGEINLETEEQKDMAVRLSSYDEQHNQYNLTCASDALNPPYFRLLSLILKKGSDGEIALNEFLVKKSHHIGMFDNRPWDTFCGFSVNSSSPIRSQPKRTYDPAREFNDPEGSDIPMLLVRLAVTRKKEWEKLKRQLIEFGMSSGLFQDIKIKNFGGTLGGPFQLLFKVKGPTKNIVDVGYGISQILPLLVQVLYPSISQYNENKPTPPSYSLLQQPEVHLHPKAQAEFTTLLTELTKQGNQSFIVETHSDYMVDRARIEIRKGNIKPEDVSLIYFEPKGNIVKVHNIGFDEMANMVGVPANYGKFFLHETNRLMGFED